MTPPGRRFASIRSVRICRDASPACAIEGSARRMTTRTSGSRHPARGLSTTPARRAPNHWVAACSATAPVEPNPRRTISPVGTLVSAVCVPYNHAAAPRTAIVPRLSTAGAPAASAKRRRAFMTAVAVPTTP